MKRRTFLRQSVLAAAGAISPPASAQTAGFKLNYLLGSAMYGGLPLATLPNARSFEAWLFGRWWIHWDGPQHRDHFTPETLSRLIEKAGFRITKIRGGVGTSFFLGSVDYLCKHVLKTRLRYGGITRHVVAGPLCLLMGHLGIRRRDESDGRKVCRTMIFT